MIITKDIFSRNIGIVNKIRLKNKSMTVDFDGRNVDYDITELDEQAFSYEELSLH